MQDGFGSVEVDVNMRFTENIMARKGILIAIAALIFVLLPPVSLAEESTDSQPDISGIFTSVSGFLAGLFKNAISVTEISVGNISGEGIRIQAGTIYYVDATSGNDSWSGTIPEPNGEYTDGPFETIQKAADIVDPGDTVIVKDGVYKDSIDYGAINGSTVLIRRGGTSSDWVTFKSENPLGAVIDGENGAKNNGIYIYRSNYIKIEGFEIRNHKDVGIRVNSNEINGHDIFIYRNKIHNIGTHRTDASCIAGDAISCGITGSDYAYNITAERNEIYDIGRQYNPNCNYTHYHWDHGIYASGFNWVIQNNIIYNSLFGSNLKLSGNSLGISGCSHLVTNNIFAHAPAYSNPGHISYVEKPSGQYTIIQNNIAYNPAEGCFIDARFIVLNSLDVFRNNVVSGDLLRYWYSSGTSTQSNNTLNLSMSDFELTDPENNDFTLTSSSTYLIDKGIDTDTPSHDFLGNLRDSQPDIGAYEYQTPVKFLQTFAIRHGGSSLVPGDEVLLAKFDIFNVNRFHYDDINGDTWGAIRTINPNIEIYNYQLGREASSNDDASSVVYINNLGRWNISREHSMGNLNIDNPELFLLDSDDNRIENSAYANDWVMDIGSNGYQDYWLEGTIQDLVDQPWTADGVFVDVTTIGRTSMTSMPVKYPSDEAWSSAMNGFINAIAVGLSNQNQKIWCNRGGTKTELGYNQSIVLDTSSNPPDVTLEEGAFAVLWGSGDVQFFNEADWKRQVDLLAEIHNSKVCYLSHSDLNEGQKGTDNHGKDVDFWDIIWYAMGSYHIAKNTVDNNSYFGFSESYNNVKWYDEFDYIDLGSAISNYQITSYGENNIYWREFEEGYVYVNPTNYNVSSITLPETCKQLTHVNFKDDPATISDANAINLTSHRGTMLLKSDYESTIHLIRSNPQPIGTLSSSTTTTNISLTTNINATCRHLNTSNTNYTDMTGTFTNTNSTNHSTEVSGLENGNTYTYYIRCNSTEGSINEDDWNITFSIAGHHKADTNNDNQIDMPELMAFISRWKANATDVSKAEVEEARGIWFGGGGY